ncbi:hypothetical protein [Janthinobacterium sp.]|uniref:hypothetical protein n=1 Tax=Janthinobacterium sp. TaxID=1871054 RepID=UPI00293D59EB|nr:hypothetical protein [Janthinobacterium sp.]
MSRMRIDFAPPGLRRSLFHAHPALWAGAALGLALCAGAAVLGGEALRRQDALRAQALAQEQRAARRGVPAPAAKIAIGAEQAAAVNAAVLQLNLPWRELQDAVAAATPPAVALLSLEPDARKRLLKLGAEVKRSEDMIAYIEELKRQELFTGVALTRHEINEQDPNKPIRFQLEATWAAP